MFYHWQRMYYTETWNGTINIKRMSHTRQINIAFKKDRRENNFSFIITIQFYFSVSNISICLTVQSNGTGFFNEEKSNTIFFATLTVLFPILLTALMTRVSHKTWFRFINRPIDHIVKLLAHQDASQKKPFLRNSTAPCKLFFQRPFVFASGHVDCIKNFIMQRVEDHSLHRKWCIVPKILSSTSGLTTIIFETNPFRNLRLGTLPISATMRLEAKLLKNQLTLTVKFKCKMLLVPETHFNKI